MVTLLVCGYAYVVWLLTGTNPLPHITIDLLLMAMLEGILEVSIIFLICMLVEEIEGKINGR